MKTSPFEDSSIGPKASVSAGLLLGTADNAA
jgi:hypothetical protein